MPRSSSAELTLAREQKPQPQLDTAAAATATAQKEWEQGWERYVKAHVHNELTTLHRALGELLAVERQKLERKAGEFDIKLAKIAGAIDVLRGAAPPPPAKFPTIKAWKEDTIYHEGDVVAFAGSTFQAQRETARAPGSQDWICIAASGTSFTIRGVYDSAATYKLLDVVMLNGASFAALKNNPGICPGDDWRLFAKQGRPGRPGERGPRGAPGETIVGPSGAFIRDWVIDRARYTATPILTDGSIGPTLNLRALFEQFLEETGAR